jgi:hypothetical protein
MMVLIAPVIRDYQLSSLFTALFLLYALSLSFPTAQPFLEIITIPRTENSDSTPTAIRRTERRQRRRNDNLQTQAAVDESASILIIALALQLGRADPCVHARVRGRSTAAIGVGRREFAREETVRSAERSILRDCLR